MNPLQEHIKHFTRLKRAPGPIWSEASRGRAPHKPLLLLAVLDLAHRGVINSPFISVTDDLVELNELFNLYWRRIVPVGQSPSSIAFPFSRLDREPFWELVPQPGQTITTPLINNTSSVSYLRRYALGAKLADGIFQAMQSEDGRSALREALLLSCFSTSAQALLREQSRINREAYDYSRLLEEQVHRQVKEAMAADRYSPEARSQGFRRLVVKTYDHRCALCGIRIVTPDGHTVVEAAHIVPWRRTRNDDLRNGMALCRTCHWGFDKGMLGVSDQYTVLTAPTIGIDPNFPGLLSMLAGRAIIPPVERDHWPSREYLAAHRREWRL
ncbi:HNH endonuclease [Desulfurivibrio alkaliphilus]|uniref:HNH nuclease n=1 Tax=Desulfurivibrio alkaliphilus (strain DSM 19089 / UNIQEM U267 / AHT2) TaxID=589865 RepID=D6Z588_DESAT|nr:HNH endonuclease [Desulfurivibrio alkaliphilus]ADH84745.1 HNH nuclease [Desulfurivibrio alkaliphilus AHT 2]